MLYFVGIWLFLSINCLILGSRILGILGSKFKFAPNSIFLSIWLGLSFLLGLLTLLALFIPLSPPIGIAIITLISMSCLTVRTTRLELDHYLAAWRGKEAFLVLSIFVLVAVFFNQRIEWFDTGLYHLGLISWLSEFGATPGIALINFHFGKFSSWFALSAPLIFDLPQNRVGAVTNGFFLLIACLQLVITLNVSRKNTKLADIFLVSFLFLYIANLLFLQPLFTSSNLAIAISFSPDMPVNLFIGIIAWSILVIHDESDADASPIFGTKNQSLLDIRLIPLILASAAATIKVTAFPLIIFSALFYLAANPRQTLRWVLAALIPCTFLLPFFAHGILASGCPLSPSPFMCFDLPWALDLEQRSAELERVTGGSYEASSFWSLWYERIQDSTKMQLMAILLTLSTALGAYISYFGFVMAKRKDFLFTVGLAWSGMAFLLMVSTTQILRFGLSYFFIVPCLFFAIVVLQRPYFGGLKLPTLRLRQSLISLSTLGLITGLIVSHSYQFGHPGEFNWILPPTLPTPKNYRIYAEQGLEVDDLVTQEVNGIVFTYPSAGNAKICWSDILVCNKPRENVHLRRPSVGLAGGFVKKS